MDESELVISIPEELFNVKLPNSYLLKYYEDLQRRTGIDWLSITDLADCILKPKGFKPGASNTTIYAVLNVLGYEVVDDEIQESQSL